MNADSFIHWLRGFVSAMHGRLGTPADFEKVAEVLTYTRTNAEIEKEIRIAELEARAENERAKEDWLREEMSKLRPKQLEPWPPVPTPTWVPSDKCSKCGLEMRGPMGYVCPHPHCPTGLGGVTCAVISSNLTGAAQSPVGTQAQEAPISFPPGTVPPTYFE